MEAARPAGNPNGSRLLMIIVVLVLAVVLVLGFGLVWWKDRNRTQEQAGDDDRLDP